MNTKYFDEIRKKKASAEEKIVKAQEFVQAKEAEIEELKNRMIRSCNELDPEAYLDLMKRVAEKKQELTGLKDIAEQTATMKGYTDEDVKAAYARYCADYNPMIGKKIKAFKQKKLELKQLYEEMAELQKEAILAREECKSYLLSNKIKLEMPSLIPNWSGSLARVFYGTAPMGDGEGDFLNTDGIAKDLAIGEYCFNVEAKFS